MLICENCPIDLKFCTSCSHENVSSNLLSLVKRPYVNSYRFVFYQISPMPNLVLLLDKYQTTFKLKTENKGSIISIVLS